VESPSLSKMNYIQNSPFLHGPCYFKASDFSVLKLSGEDTNSYLQGQTTNDVSALAVDDFHQNALTDVKGRLIGLFYLWRRDDSYWLVCSKDRIQQIKERLDQFLISEDVEIEEIHPSLYFSLNNPSNKGQVYALDADIVEEAPPGIPELTAGELERLQFLSGEIDCRYDELINNSYIADLVISYSKGCYPGQETVSKIYNNRGAAKFPLCLIGKSQLANGPIRYDDKKIGECFKSIAYQEIYLHYCYLNRENRVENKELELSEGIFKVVGYPLFPKDSQERSQQLYEIALESFHSDQINDALKYLKAAIHIDPTNEDAYEIIGVIHGREEQYDEAIEWMHKLSKISPKSVMAHTNLSLYYMKQGEIEKAEEHKGIATFKTFEKLGDDAEAKRLKEAAIEQAQAEKEQRMSMYQQVLEIDEDDALANFGIGQYLLEDGEYAKSIEHLKKALNADPQYSVAYLALGKALLAMADSAQASEVFEKGIIIASKKGDFMPANEMQSLLNTLN
jgi:folate-binding Fe-S cluster repair protein YgfZ/Tfp pilus assembly protein PilF